MNAPLASSWFSCWAPHSMTSFRSSVSRGSKSSSMSMSERLSSSALEAGAGSSFVFLSIIEVISELHLSSSLSLKIDSSMEESVSSFAKSLMVESESSSMGSRSPASIVRSSKSTAKLETFSGDAR